LVHLRTHAVVVVAAFLALPLAALGQTSAQPVAKQVAAADTTLLVLSSPSDAESAIDLKAEPLAPLVTRAEVGSAVLAAPPAAATTSAVTPVPAQAAKSVAPLQPQATGLERLSDDWPKAVKVGVQYRGRSEEQRGSSITGGRDDGYYLNRLRLESTVTVKPWLKAFGQVQDSQTLGYNIAAQPTGLTDTLDLRQGFVEARLPTTSGLGVRVGRQEISLGEQRLVGASDWSNTARTFDAVRVFVTRPGVQVDAFVSSVVVITQNAFDQWKPNEKFSGTYVSLSRLVPKSVIEPYVFARVQNNVTSELGTVGDGATYTFGARAAGLLPHRFDYGVEVAAERGHISTDEVDAWAGHYTLGWTIGKSAIKPRLVVEFNNASGDSNPKDGRRETFDQLYPTNHSKYGIADQMDWRNMRDAMVGVEFMPVRKLKLNADVHRLSLATTADGLYTGAAAPKVLNRNASSLGVGTETDIQSVYALSKELSFNAGVSVLVAGDFLAQSTTTGTLWTPYVMWTVKF
jgi:hypothetical protein